ncbi:MAG: protein-L-isoaspartate O-methyltransferase [Neisseriales bacterium]|nr:MAG: protein-L-isoaspartate O-methyltransferase [Neisseriales bacterium]
MNFEQARFNMVEQQVRPWNVFDENVLAMLTNVKREEFVSPEYKAIAFSDVEIPLPGGQKMLFPRVEARMLQELNLSKKDKVLEIGTGSGYVTAMLGKLTDFVYSIEINAKNKEFAVSNLTKAGIKNVSIIEGDGLNGLAAKAPFDKILVGGSLPVIPQTLKQQLKVGGHMVAVIGTKPAMHAVHITRIAENEFIEKQIFETIIDELTGAHQNQFKF